MPAPGRRSRPYQQAKGLLCSEPECSRPTRSRGLCHSHYNALCLKGLPEDPPADPNQKWCSRCRSMLPTTMFNPCRLPSGLMGFDSWCRPCERVRAAERAAALTPEEKRQKAARAKEVEQRRRLADPEAALRRDLRRSCRRLDLNPDFVIAFWENHGHRCDVCQRHPQPDERRFHLDHDHNNGKFRGILCSQCNTLLGQAQESIMILQAAIDYLARAVSS